MKVNLQNVTVLIPVRIDSIIRLENVLAVISYLWENFELNIMVWEAAPYNNHKLQRLLPSNVLYEFSVDNDPVFYRTKYINNMAQMQKSGIVAVWDADVLLPVHQVSTAVSLITTNDCDIVYPYDGIFLDTSICIRQMYMENPNVSLLEELAPMMPSLYGKGSFGGVFFVDAEVYRRTGMENLNFYGWGAEDWERYERWRNMGYKIGRVKGDLFHLWHPRDMNGRYNSDRQRKLSNYESLSIKYSSAEEIKARMGLE